MTRSTPIPPMQALRAFEAVARLGSTVQAANDLNITPSAITHQLRKLEDIVGKKLVQRTGRNIMLTTAGKTYAQQISQALKAIAEAAHIDNQDEPQGNLCINCAPGFGTYWLSLHLKKFVALYPDISIRVVTPDGQHDVYSSDVDVSIVYGDGMWPDMTVELLYTPKFFPVCSPLLVGSFEELSSPNDIAKFPLIHHQDYTAWASWLAAVSANHVKVDSGFVFGDINHYMSATLAGLGIALGDNIESQSSLQDGSLVRLFRHAVQSSQSYYLVANETRKRQPACAAWLNWISTEFNIKP